MSVSNDQVAHAFAHGVAAAGGNMVTDGKELTSYSTTMAYNTGRGLVFITSDGWTPTTKKQLFDARRACSHLDVVYSPIFEMGLRLSNFDEKQAFKMACDALNDQLEGYSVCRLSKYLGDAVQRAYELATKLNDYAVKYGFEPCAFHQLTFERRRVIGAHAAQFKSKAIERQEAARAREQALLDARRVQDQEEFDAWRAGYGHCPGSFRYDADGGHYIAVHGDKVVTSGGAECPIEDARKGIAFWCSRKGDEGRSMSGATYHNFNPWHRNGERVLLGIFQLDRIEPSGTAYAGCHRFNVAELQRLADALL